ncbi:MAG TPA: ABC transporter ATP-binding protein [Caulobacteraceae bacterium]|jgi:lipopolysaccharide transport system ATP-binding protein
MSSDALGDVAVAATGLGKQYRVGAGPRHNTLRDAVTASFRSLAKPRSTRQGAEKFWALRDVSFQIRQGENVGILGLNGAGKSTLLKVLSRVITPTTGRARITGRLGALLEVGTGFHFELTGRENIYLYGAILGMTRAEIARNFEAIVEFAGVGEFIDTPVKRYSSGMYVRLAFSVAAHLDPDILLLDEVLSVGDIAFQRKCIDFAKSLQKRNATILFVSHNMFSIKTMCERVIYLRNGRIEFDGPTARGIELYEADSQLSEVAWAKFADLSETGRPVRITNVALSDETGVPRGVFDRGERLRLRISYKIDRPIESPNFIVAIIRSDGVCCCDFCTVLDGMAVEPTSGAGVLQLTTPPLTLVSELYRIEVLVRENGFDRLLCAQGGGSFHIRDELLDTNFGVFHEPGHWTQETESPPQRPIAQNAAHIAQTGPQPARAES